MAEELVTLDLAVECEVMDQARTDHARVNALRASHQEQNSAAREEARARQDRLDEQARKDERTERRARARLQRRERRNARVAALTDQHRKDSLSRIEARVRRYEHEVETTARRVHAATQQLDRTRQLLLGPEATWPGGEDVGATPTPHRDRVRVDTAMPPGDGTDVALQVELLGHRPKRDGLDDDGARSTDLRDPEAA